MNTEAVLTSLLSAQGRTVRSGQAAAASHIDAGAQHVAAMCPTGVGKSALAVAVSVAREGGIVAANSNGLVAQYVAEIPEWEAALGIKVAALVGRAHYWCPIASPTLEGFTADQAAFVRENGTFIGSGVEKAVYINHSVNKLAPVADEDEPEVKKSPCTRCPLKANKTCPLWNARAEAALADVVVTNATVLGMALKGSTDWATAIQRNVVVLDEADSCREPISNVFGAEITVRGAKGRKDAYESVLADSFLGDESKRNIAARRFVATKKLAEAEGREMTCKVEEGKVILNVPADLVKVFAEVSVVAMSATLSQRNVDDLGLNATVANFQGLDVSASTVTVLADAPGWAWGKDGPPADWSAFVANELTTAFRNGGRTLGLFQSNADLAAVTALLPADVRKGVLVYSSKTDRTTVVKTYTAAPESHLLLGLVQGAGRGLNLPGDLLRTVVVSRVPQRAPKDADKAVWLEDSRASITQSVGRAHRHADDWGNVRIVGGFGIRKDVAEALDGLGWKIGS